ncbi:hypothetical protein D8S82_32025 [Mycobacterium hodleri]|uniref:Uncharacterized protein n=1 Tax=Mycolicibacterium hodleri TaxID=49897 RepID=A0A544VR58_9MYCO|nr:hypothetical protein D8S82_32025 [Mycolicibacterium hodleri]
MRAPGASSMRCEGCHTD